MNKENKKGAASLRRSAIAERIRLREEWSALKEIDTQSQPTRLNAQNTNTALKRIKAMTKPPVAPVIVSAGRLNRKSNTRIPSEPLRGVVALVEVGSEPRALPLRAALAALGASVLPAWSPLVTHLIWAQGGCRSTRARARALASALVSPLWVEACAAAEARLSERAFPAAARASDLPSPTALRRMLKKAEAENIPFANLLTDSDEKEKVPRLRISAETDPDTSADTFGDTSLDTSKDTSKDTSRDTSKDATKDNSMDTTKETTTDIETRVNTALRRALPKLSESVSPRPVAKSRRKLFTHKEAEMAGSTDDDDEITQPKPNIPKPKTQQARTKQLKTKQVQESDRKELARAERMAKKFLAACSGATAQKPVQTQNMPRIVLTGMNRTKRREMTAAIVSLKGRVQRAVDKRTTHVVLGSFQRDEERAAITGVINLTPEDLSRVIHRSDVQKARTLSALCGASRGCRVLTAQWVTDSVAASKWAHHAGYEVQHLNKISQKARVERTALAKLRSEYAYDVFCGMRVFVSPSAEQRDAAIQLLNLCGAVVQNGGTHNCRNPNTTQNNKSNDFSRARTQLERLNHNGGTQNGGNHNLTRGRDRLKTPLTQKTQHAAVTQNGEIRYGLVAQNGEYDVRIGIENGDISSKWVFDSVASARMRTTRRYVVNNRACPIMEEMANCCIDC